MKLLTMVYPIITGIKKILRKAKEILTMEALQNSTRNTPTVDILEEYYFPMLFIQIGNLMTFDIYVSSFNLVIEYHRYQHYYDHYMFGDAKSCKERDSERRLACINQNINYLEVLYWWHCDKLHMITSIL